MKTSLKSKIGLGIIVLGVIFPVFSVIVPFLGLSKGMTATIITLMVVGAPEVCLLVGGILAGKEGVDLVKGKIKKMLGLPAEEYPATSTQYKIGVGCIIAWFIITVASGYLPNIFEDPFVKDNLLYLSIGTDILLILGVFAFGGNQMITKLGEAFRWQPWVLPEKEK
ncbi:transporter suffix domain-containing protein [Flammeovirga aprica]|uniref:Transporter suffix domain-containing protein n=1 Tax=Flammeovirga aprica JL-4 TaxID=694437 RepID=A0A7X9P1M9_9BACT|nr:transporter suffix domain-containing protein [Flammeovirga aprica]NME67868.1 transporter suffix domain-containing protein [Flammeovirga aprica JL-4]